jgi:hypothetical protein
MAALPTVQIVNPTKPDEYLILNAQDFDPAQHTLFSVHVLKQAQAAVAAAVQDAAASTPPARTVPKPAAKKTSPKR